MTNEEKQQKRDQISDFICKLDDYVACVVSDATADCSDSYTGMGASKARGEMEDALYELFDIGE